MQTCRRLGALARAGRPSRRVGPRLPTTRRFPSALICRAPWGDRIRRGRIRTGHHPQADAGTPPFSPAECINCNSCTLVSLARYSAPFYSSGLVTFEVTLRSVREFREPCVSISRSGAVTEGFMATYISLMNWTDRGIGQFKNTVERAEAAKQLAAKHGGKLKDIYWTVGPYDLVAITEARDDESATAFSLALGALGNVRTTTLRAFSGEDMRRIVAKATD